MPKPGPKPKQRLAPRKDSAASLHMAPRLQLMFRRCFCCRGVSKVIIVWHIHTHGYVTYMTYIHACTFFFLY